MMDAPEGEPTSPSYTICLKVAGDGSLSVGVETGDPAAADSAMGDGEAEPDYKPVGSLEEATAMMQDIIANKGQMPEDSADADLAAAKTGYARKAKAGPSAPNPGALFGE